MPELSSGLGSSTMRWSTIGGLCSLKALVLACVLAPLPAATVTPAYAQFQFIVPIPGIDFRGPRHYYGRGYRTGRYSRRGGRSRGESGSASSSAPSTARASAAGGKVRGTVD
jgi:hypothetical protein